MVFQICTFFFYPEKSLLAKTVNMSVFVQDFWTFISQVRTTARWFQPACCFSALYIQMAKMKGSMQQVLPAVTVPASSSEEKHGHAVKVTQYSSSSFFSFLFENTCPHLATCPENISSLHSHIHFSSCLHHFLPA